MIHSVVEELKNYRETIDNEFQHRLDLAAKSIEDMCIVPSVQRLAKYWNISSVNHIVLTENRSDTFVR